MPLASTILDNIVTISEKPINSMRQPEPKYLETSQNKHIYSEEQIKILRINVDIQTDQCPENGCF